MAKVKEERKQKEADMPTIKELREPGVVDRFIDETVKRSFEIGEESIDLNDGIKSEAELLYVMRRNASIPFNYSAVLDAASRFK